jgi:hypothetical protein
LPKAELPWGSEDLLRDLELAALLEEMAGGDAQILASLRQAVLSSAAEPDLQAASYRQAVLEDARRCPELITSLYDLANQVIAAERKTFHSVFTEYPSARLHAALEAMDIFVGAFGELRGLADRYLDRLQSEGLCRFLASCTQEFSESYLAELKALLAELAFPAGLFLAAELGTGGYGRYRARKRPRPQGNWLQRKLAKSPGLSFSIDERDEGGANALSELRDRGIERSATLLSHYQDQVLAFFTALRDESAFYLGALRWQRLLEESGAPSCTPLLRPVAERALSFTDLRDAYLLLRLRAGTVPNALAGDGALLVTITGANQGGKSTFLRSVGLAQLLMQAGLPVPATSFSASLAQGVFSHFRREEDAEMRRGKFDEEVARFSQIVDHLAPGSMLLCNESFAATNEREGSLIALQVVHALSERRVRVLFVTHLYEFARQLWAEHDPGVLFLRAERGAEGQRSYRIRPGEPLSTSFGRDLYERIFAVQGTG